MKIHHRDINKIDRFLAFEILIKSNLILIGILKNNLDEDTTANWHLYDEIKKKQLIRDAICIMGLEQDELILLLKPCYALNSDGKKINVVDFATNQINMKIQPTVWLQAVVDTVFMVFENDDFSSDYLKKK